MKIRNSFLLLRMIVFVTIIGCSLTSYAQQSRDKRQSASEPTGSSFYCSDEILSERLCVPTIFKGIKNENSWGIRIQAERCRYCHGDGGRPCPTCNKKGVVPCSCKGYDDDCQKCDGTGWRPCPNRWCYNGIEICRACKGTGKE